MSIPDAIGIAFAKRFKYVREHKINAIGKPLSQEKTAMIFRVSLSCIRGWEKVPPRSLPDVRSRILIEEIWPEVFNASMEVKTVPLLSDIRDGSSE